MLSTILLILFLAACVILVAAVLLQPGKSDAGALFTSNISSTAFGPRGTASVLSKITIGAATVFMLMAFLLAQPAITGNRSVLESGGAPTDSPAPEASPAAVATDANANVSTSVNPTDGNTNAVTPSNTNAATPATGNANK